MIRPVRDAWGALVMNRNVPFTGVDRMRRVCLFLFLLVLGGWAEGSARAGISYQYVTDATNYNAVAGTNVTANVYL
jgi:hypothetical protein